MSKKSTTETSNLVETEAAGKKIAVQSWAEVSKWNRKKKIIGSLMVFMILCTISCFLSGSAAMDASKSAIHEIEALLYYVLAAINCCSAILLWVIFEKE